MIRIALATVLGLLVLAVGTARAAPAPDVQVAPATSLANGSMASVTASAPIQLVGPLTQSTAINWDPAIAVLAGAVTAPQGWTPEYTVDGSAWSAALPADPTTVRGVRASGPVESNGVSGGRQAVTTVNNATSVTPAPTFPAAGGGDGYDIFGAPDYILTAYHHTQPFTLSCFTRATGAACSPSTYTGNADLRTAYASNGITIGTKVYVATRNAVTGKGGLACTDVAQVPFQDCGFKELVPSVYAPAPNWLDFWGGNLALSGTRIYSMIQDEAGFKASIVCFDTATDAPCPGQPYLSHLDVQNSGWGPAGSFVGAFGGRVYAVGAKLWCLNAADGTPCAGWQSGGVATGVQMPGNTKTTNPVPRRNANGDITGVCILAMDTSGAGCWDLNQASVSLPTGLSTMITGPANEAIGAGLNSYQFNGNRQYWLRWPYGGAPSNPVCYDWTTDAACAGFSTTTAAGQRYTISFDAFDPDCGFTYGNDAVVTTFHSRFGGGSCSGGPKMTLAAQASVPRLGCSASSAILAWGSVTVTPPGGVSVTAFRVTVRDSSGVPIPGYSGLSPNAQGVVDVSGLPASASGQSPTITVDAVGATMNQANATTIAVTRETDFPQLCVPVQAAASCPAASPGSFPGGLMPLAPLVITGEVRETPSSGPASTFPLSASATRSSVPGCLGGLGGTVTFTDGTPAAGRTVTLLAPDGTVVATTTTGSAGGYAFPSDLGPSAGYSVAVGGITKTGAVQAGAVSTVDFQLPLPPSAALPVQASASRDAVARGVVEVTVTAPAAGIVAVVGTTSIGGTRVRACSGRRSVRRAGKVRLSCMLTRTVRVAACSRPLRVGLRTTFTPRSGAALSSRTQVVVPRTRCTGPAVTG